jgi:hypothetical protein
LITKEELWKGVAEELRCFHYFDADDTPQNIACAKVEDVDGNIIKVS